MHPLCAATLFPVLFTMLAVIFPLKDQPMLLSIIMPTASFLGLGLVPGLLGILGDISGFAVGFMLMAIMSVFSWFLLRFVPAN